MRVGRLRHRLAIESRGENSPSRTSTGAVDYSWSTLATVWGSLEPLQGRRLEIAQATHEKVTVESMIRYRSDVTAGMRIAFGDKYYLIDAVINPELRNRYLRLLCEEGVATE